MSIANETNIGLLEILKDELSDAQHTIELLDQSELDSSSSLILECLRQAERNVSVLKNLYDVSTKGK